MIVLRGYIFYSPAYFGCLFNSFLFWSWIKSILLLECPLLTASLTLASHSYPNICKQHGWNKIIVVRWMSHDISDNNLQWCFQTQLGSIRCKHNVRWQHRSQRKDVSFCLIKLISSCEKCSRLSSGTCNAIYNWRSPIRLSRWAENSMSCSPRHRQHQLWLGVEISTDNGWS